MNHTRKQAAAIAGVKAADVYGVGRKGGNGSNGRKPVTVEVAVASWREWSPEQRAEFGRAAGISEIWDCAISPVISDEREAVS